MPELRFERNMKVLSWSCFLFAVLHLVLAPLAFAGTHPIIPIKIPIAHWEVANNEFILGVFFLWSGILLRISARCWSTRSSLTLAIAAGIAAYFAVDGLYLAIRPMPGSAGWAVLSKVLAGFMGINALVGANAVYLLIKNPVPKHLPQTAAPEQSAGQWRKLDPGRSEATADAATRQQLPPAT